MMAKAPLCKPSLTAPAASPDRAGSESAIRVLSVLFDTSDEPKTAQMNFQEVLNAVKLDKILPQEDL